MLPGGSALYSLGYSQVTVCAADGTRNAAGRNVTGFALMVQESLALEEGQEEAFVIRASGNKLLEARIDQLRRVVTVTKIARQTFTAAQWQQLRAQLASWKVGPLSSL